MQARRWRSSGFTLVEMMITLVLFSAMVMLAFPRYKDFQQSMAMKATVRNMATNLRLAQQKAVSANRRCYLDLDAATKSYTLWLDLDRDNAFDGIGEVRAAGFPYTELQGSLPAISIAPIASIVSTTLPTGVRGFPQVAFTTDGGVANPGEIVLGDTQGRQYKLEITAAGSISIYQKIGGAWKE